MFKLHEIWKFIDESTMAIYFCFEDLEQNKFCVQNVEFYKSPLDVDRDTNARNQTAQLFVEENPVGRSDWGNSLLEAIKIHDDYFSD